MKKIFLIAAIGIAGLFLVSCKAKVENMKDIRNMPIRFKPLSRNDMSLVGNLQAEATISYKVSRAGITKLEKNYKDNLKTGLVTNQNSNTSVLYFSPGSADAVITGDMFDVVDQSVTATLNSAGTKAIRRLVAKRNYFYSSYLNSGSNFYYRLYVRYKQLVENFGAGDGPNFAYYALVEKYPDIDYFINVRFDRKTVLKGKVYTETVIVKADGVKLKTD
jgi:hypothetical protein